VILLIYVFSLFVFSAGYYKYIAYKESQKTLVQYTKDNMPTHSAVLLYGTENGIASDVILESINIADGIDSIWKLYQTPGNGEVEVDHHYDSCHYVIKTISDTRKQVRLSFWVGGGDRKELYIYEIEDDRVYPQSYNELADYFGWSFTAFPFAFISTFLFIIIFEVLVVRRFIFKKNKVES
jgi:hypothetical protein